MNIVEQTRDGYMISTDRSKLDLDLIHHYLATESYWAKNIPLDVVKKSIEGAVCFGVYAIKENGSTEQVGFARVITDLATFGYLADVFILDPHRGKGLSKWLMSAIMAHPGLQGFRRWMLATRDAHGLYRQFGFQPLEKPERFLRYSLFDEYPLSRI